MKQFIIAALAVLLTYSNGKAQDSSAILSQQFMQVTSVESVLSGGLGRSKMIVTNPDGSQKESDMENLFSMVGINFKNINPRYLTIINFKKQ